MTAGMGAGNGRTVMMFAGQGAQYYQMGRELFGADPVFRAAMLRCDQAAGPIEGRSITEIIYGRPMAESESFDRQMETAPALLAVGWSLAQVLFARGIQPELLLGYSLGETIAATVAGVLPLEDAFALLFENARIIEAMLPPAAMLAVLEGAARVAALPAVRKAGAEVAAENSDRHCVLTLPRAALPALRAALEAEGLIVALVPVRHGFHSSLLAPAESALQAAASRRAFAPPRYRLVSCATTEILPGLTAAHLWQVARGPILFAETLRKLVAEGTPLRFVEAGPTGTLATFTRQVLGPKTLALPAINQFGQDLRSLEILEERFG
ncbi:acyltransferase domain-containing protein [Falsiroseomonas tokyonensis]|uniref:Acyltransferase domain-containing protein n=1 Tax=Falsiroseomonas tokyonensis TaxID=430521 RepID=A0ABV7BMF0_9PROT|nr:acyltransferase domain-containing protein [Falsiroseomonas tokyonensis]MBU8536769.1 acyltransferase domain-containing protein [Falsiroseomonas tokyonensis]